MPNHIFFYAVFFAGCAVRLLFLSRLPKGLNQDEAYSGYEAWSLLNFGIDSWGYRNPVHFITWGSGMNALYVYLSMLPIKLFGLSVFSVRIPQALFGCLTLIMFYFFCKKLASSEKDVCGGYALFSLCMLCINPWHIMLSRWANDCNVVIFFILTGMYCFYRGLEKSSYLILSAIFYGLALYGYPIMWVTLPFVIIFSVIYCGYCRKLHFTKELVAATVVLLALATPLFLFILVNYGVLAEIKTQYFSIPKLVLWRDTSRFSVHILFNIKNAVRILVFQIDELFNEMPNFGLYYLLSLPFILYGFIKLMVQGITKIRQREFEPLVMPLFFLFGAIFYLLFGDTTANRINIVHLPIVFCLSFGLYDLLRLVKSMNRLFWFCLICSYVINFLGFIVAYSDKEPYFYHGFEAALARSMAQPKDVYLNDIAYPVFLFTVKYPTDKYLKNASDFRKQKSLPKSAGYFHFGIDRTAFLFDKDAVYVFENNMENTDLCRLLRNDGFTLSNMDNFIYAEVITGEKNEF
jgi:4-amino-4-deoxy-L-arabinose transferase-like glycosyltransferase